MFGIGIGEIAVILLFATLIFGPKEMAKHAKTLFRFFGKLSKFKDEITYELNDSRPTNKTHHKGKSNDNKE